MRPESPETTRTGRACLRYGPDVAAAGLFAGCASQGCDGAADPTDEGAGPTGTDSATGDEDGNPYPDIPRDEWLFDRERVANVVNGEF